MLPSERLRKAKQRISDPKMWTRGASFRLNGKALMRDPVGSEVGAVQCCMLGALWEQTGAIREANDALESVCAALIGEHAVLGAAGYSAASVANDRFLTHEGVMWVYDLAIARLESEGR